MVIPSDVGFTHLSFFQQTRYKAARHQMSRMEYADLVDLVSCAFGSLADDKRLWCFSPQSLRNALQQHATAERGLDLGSLGGTTHLLLATEDAELIRRRGRWLAQPTMEVYLQEITATVFFCRMASGTKAKILQLALSFPALLTSMMQFSKLGISPRWYTLLEKGTDGNEGPTRWSGRSGCKEQLSRAKV